MRRPTSPAGALNGYRSSGASRDTYYFRAVFLGCVCAIDQSPRDRSGTAST